MSYSFYSSSSGCQRYLPDQYVIKTPAAGLPITLAEVKAQARLDPVDTSEDSYLTHLISTATSIAESYMNRDIINKTYTAFLNAFPLYEQQGIELQRSKLQSLTSIKYYIAGVLTVFDPSNYYTTLSDVYSSIFLNASISWPQDADVRQQVIQIEFVAGLGAAEANIPEDIKQALKQHVTFLYQSRGDSADGGFGDRIPDVAKAIYEQYKIYNPIIN